MADSVYLTNPLGGGGSSGITIGTTTITSGTTTRILYNNAGVVGEYTVTGSGTTAVLSTAPTLTGPVTLTGAVDSSALTITGGTQTSSFPALSITQTWNNAGVTFVGKSNAITSTASAAGSDIEQWSVGGTVVAAINKNGSVRFGPYSANNPIAVKSGSITGAVAIATFDGGGYAPLACSTLYLAGDAVLERDAVNVIAQRFGTNAQTFRLYNTYTDASNYERLNVGWNTNVIVIGPENAGTGSSRNMRLEFTSTPTRIYNVSDTLWIRSSGNFMNVSGLYADGTLTFSSSGDVHLTREAAATLQMGLDVNGAAVAQTFKAHDGITGTNIGGANLQLAGGRGTGSGAPGDLILQTATALGSGTTAQTLATRLTLSQATLTFADAVNVAFNTTTGTKFGTATTQKLGFYNATPIVQGASVADATGGATIDAEARTAINALISRIEALGLIATV